MEGAFYELDAPVRARLQRRGADALRATSGGGGAAAGGDDRRRRARLVGGGRWLSSACRRSAPTWRPARCSSGASQPGDAVQRGDIVALDRHRQGGDRGRDLRGRRGRGAARRARDARCRSAPCWRAHPRERRGRAPRAPRPPGPCSRPGAAPRAAARRRARARRPRAAPAPDRPPAARLAARATRRRGARRRPRDRARAPARAARSRAPTSSARRAARATGAGSDARAARRPPPRRGAARIARARDAPGDRGGDGALEARDPALLSRHAHRPDARAALARGRERAAAGDRAAAARGAAAARRRARAARGARAERLLVDGAFRPSEAIHVGVAISLRPGGPGRARPPRRRPQAARRADGDAPRSGARARAPASLRSSELSDATITVTNLGDSGRRDGLRRDPPAAGRARRLRPRARGAVGRGRQLVVRARSSTATLSADHRASDGHRGARFLAAIDRLLQAPESL